MCIRFIFWIDFVVILLQVVIVINIVEILLIIDGIYYVVDLGFVKQKVYNFKLGIDVLVVIFILQVYILFVVVFLCLVVVFFCLVVFLELFCVLFLEVLVFCIKRF